MIQELDVVITSRRFCAAPLAFCTTESLLLDRRPCVNASPCHFLIIEVGQCVIRRLYGCPQLEFASAGCIYMGAADMGYTGYMYVHNLLAGSRMGTRDYIDLDSSAGLNIV